MKSKLRKTFGNVNVPVFPSQGREVFAASIFCCAFLRNGVYYNQEMQ
jgi:hypothetical protein